VPWLRRLAAGLPPRRPGFDPGSVNVEFVVDKVALGQVFTEYFGFPLSISFHRFSITRKRTNNNNHHRHLHHRVAQEASRLRCVRSVCCGALHHKKNTVPSMDQRGELKEAEYVLFILGNLNIYSHAFTFY
jgi:hypothetical protein